MNITELLELLNQTTACVQEKGFWAERERLENGKRESLVLIAELALCMTELGEALDALAEEDVVEKLYAKDGAASELAGFYIRIHEVLTRNRLEPSILFTQMYDRVATIRTLSKFLGDANRCIIEAMSQMLLAFDYARKLDMIQVTKSIECATHFVARAFIVLNADPILAVRAELERNTKREHRHGKLA